MFGCFLAMYLVSEVPQVGHLGRFPSMVVLFVVPLVLLGLVNTVFGRNIAVLSQSGLAKSLDTVLKSPMRVPVLLSLSREAQVNDPDDPHYYFDIFPPGYGQTALADTRRVWTTDYVRLDSLDRDKVKEACLASAALPFGIVPPVQIGETIYVDGGLTDNVPVFPFINDPAHKEVFVIMLQPPKRCSKPGDDEASPRRMAGLDDDCWSKRERAIRVANFPISHQILGFGKWGERNRPPKILPYARPNFMPKPTFFYPTQSLGNLMSGTLNFNGDYAADLIEKGYKETLTRLNEINEHRPAP
jgi:hypothetical protein